MTNFPSKNVIENLKNRFPHGTRIELVRMDDPYSKLNPGDQGTVDFVDDIGTIFCTWDSGSSLGVVYGVDVIMKI